MYAIRFALKADPGYEFAEHPTITVDADAVGNAAAPGDPLILTAKSDYISVLYRFPLTYIAQRKTPIYADPDTASAELGVLFRGEVIMSPTYPLEAWCRVQFNGDEAWVERDALQLTYDEAKAGLQYCSVTAGAVNIRAEMNESSYRLGGMTQGRLIQTTALCKDSDGTEWYTIDYNGKLGFVMRKYLKETKSVNLCANTPPSQIS